MAADGLEQVLAGAHVSAEVTAPRPDHRALLLAVDGLVPGPGDARSEALLVLAEDEVRTASAGPVEELPRVAAWWEAYRAFGAKPPRTRNSLEALLRRAPDGLPRVDRLTDVYNAVSVLYQVPPGGEDLAAHVGPPRLVRATGNEPFDTGAGGAAAVEHPEPGEVVWRDDAGRHLPALELAPGPTHDPVRQHDPALFVLDALEPLDDDALTAAADDLAGARLGPVARRLPPEGAR